MRCTSGWRCAGDVHFEVFTREYFHSLGQRMPDQTRYFIWRHAGRIVAFSFCTVYGWRDLRQRHRRR